MERWEAERPAREAEEQAEQAAREQARLRGLEEMVDAWNSLRLAVRSSRQRLLIGLLDAYERKRHLVWSDSEDEALWALAQPDESDSEDFTTDS